MEICETSVVPIPMVPCLHQSNGYIKRKLRVWRAPKMFCPSRCRTSTYQCRATNWKYVKVRAYLLTWYGISTREMFISKGSYGYGKPKNVLFESVEKPHLPVHVSKLPRFMGGSIGPRMEICETLGLPIPMVPCFHKRNVYIKRKLRLWRGEKCIALVGAETALTSAVPQTTPFHGG